MTTEPKPLPKLKTDKEAEDFVDTADLTEFDMSEFKPVRFEMKAMPDEVYVGFSDLETFPQIWDFNVFDGSIKYTRAEPVNKQMLDALKRLYQQQENLAMMFDLPMRFKDSYNEGMSQAYKAITAAEQCQQDTVAIPRDLFDKIANGLEDIAHLGSPYGKEKRGNSNGNVMAGDLADLLKPYVKGGE